MPSRTLLDDLSETQAELQRLSGDPNASEVELISAQAQLATIHDLIAKMAPLGTSAGESTDAAARNVAAAEALAAMTLERDAAGDLTVDGMKVLPWSGAVLGTASFAYKAGP